MILILYLKINSFDLYGESFLCCRFFSHQQKARKVHQQQKMQQIEYQRNTEFVLKKKKSMNIGFFRVFQSILLVLPHLNFNKVIYVALVNSLCKYKRFPICSHLFTSSLSGNIAIFIQCCQHCYLQVECWFCSPMPEL